MLYANLHALFEIVRAAAGDAVILAHPDTVVSSLEDMLRTAKKFNDKIHFVVRTFVISLGAREYSEGE